MTKRVRIENADCNTSAWLLVEVWERGSGMEGEDVLVEVNQITGPADILSAYIHSNRYIVIKEKAQ